METLIIVLLGAPLILALILTIRSFSKTKELQLNSLISDNFLNFSQHITHMRDSNAQFEKDSLKTLIDFQDRLKIQFDKLEDRMELRLEKMDHKMNLSLEEGFKKTNETFVNIAERLSKIDEAQKKIDSLSIEIVSLQDVLTDKKTRGTFGEVQLNNLLYSIFGEKNDGIFQTQYSINSNRADAVIFAPEPLGTLAIDSKFPLENYRKMIDKELSEYERKLASKQFVLDCKVHVDAIASKYIVPGLTSDQAIMFVPAEAVFATINAYHPEIIDYAQRKRVWLVSPTTLMSTLTTIQTILINLEREKYAALIHQQLQALGEEFNRFSIRWDKLSSRLEGVNKDMKELNTTSTKITKRFESIASTDAIGAEDKK